MTKRDYLSGLELSAGETLDLIERALIQKRETEAGKRHTSLAGKNFALLFEKSSTRTRVSFQVGVAQLGGTSIFLSPNDTQISRGETIADTARVLSEYLDGLIVRTFGHDRVAGLAEMPRGVRSCRRWHIRILSPSLGRMGLIKRPGSRLSMIPPGPYKPTNMGWCAT